MKPDQFRSTTQVRVRNYEIDWQGIVHNSVYLLYFEIGRIEYLKNLGVNIDINSIQHDHKVVLVRNEINYKAPARFDELLDVHTRIASIGNTSFTFEAYIEETKRKERISENVAIHVWLNPRTNEPTKVGDDFRKLVQKFEGENVTIEWQTYLA